MSKAEDYIEDSIMNISNEVLNLDMDSNKVIYQPWLTPNQARKAVEIARKEVMDEVCDYIKNNFYKHLYAYNGHAVFLTHQFINELKQAMKDE